MSERAQYYRPFFYMLEFDGENFSEWKSRIVGKSYRG